MKTTIAILLIGLITSGCRSTPNYQLIETELSSEEMLARITTLNSYITPPNGTSKTDVDAVFGEPIKYNGFVKGGFNYYYQLIPSKELSPGTRLDVIYTENKIVNANINHMYIIQGIVRNSNVDAPSWHIFCQRPLSDLIHIKNKHEKELKTAPWNEGNPNQSLDLTRKGAQSIDAEFDSRAAQA